MSTILEKIAAIESEVSERKYLPTVKFRWMHSLRLCDLIAELWRGKLQNLRFLPKEGTFTHAFSRNFTDFFIKMA